jgi:hypothetical protein
MLEIKEVNTPHEIEQFIKLHELLYATDSLYVLPIRKDMKKMLEKQLLSHEYKEPVTAFNVYLDQQIAGRIWLTVFTARPGTPKAKRQGAFNFLEAIDDETVFFALFDQANAWYTTHSIDYFYGNTNPLDPDDARGVLIEGFVDAPTTMCVYNKPYFQRHLEKYGFLTHEDLYGYKLLLSDIPYQRYDAIQTVKDRYGFDVKSADKKHVDKEARDVIEIINHSISDDWDMRAPEPEKVYELLNTWKAFMDFDYIKIARTHEGRPIGFGMMIPNFNEALIHLKGKWNLWAILKLLYYKKRITTTRAMIQMVVLDYQGKGVINAIYQDYFKVLSQRNIRYIDASTIEASNHKSRAAVEKLGAKRYKVFRLYGLNVLPSTVIDPENKGECDQRWPST